MGRRCEDIFSKRANLLRKTIFCAQKTNFPVWPSVIISLSSLNLLHGLPSAASTPCIHRFQGQPTGLFPSGFYDKYLLGLLSSSILVTCPYHLNLLRSISSNNGVTCNSALMVVFLILSFRETPFVVLSTLISAACNFHSVLVVDDQTFESYSNMGFSIV